MFVEQSEQVWEVGTPTDGGGTEDERIGGTDIIKQKGVWSRYVRTLVCEDFSTVTVMVSNVVETLESRFGEW